MFLAKRDSSAASNASRFRDDSAFFPLLGGCRIGFLKAHFQGGPIGVPPRHQPAELVQSIAAKRFAVPPAGIEPDLSESCEATRGGGFLPATAPGFCPGGQMR